jgi:hypothetical protein
LYDSSTLTINSGAVVATGKSASGGSVGINASSSVIINGGTVEAKGETRALSTPTINTTAYTYWTNTTAADPGGTGTLFFGAGGIPILGSGAAFSYSASDKFVKIESSRVALVTDVTVTGTAGTALPSQPGARIWLFGCTVGASFSSSLVGGLANAWFSNLPAGVNVRASATTGQNFIELEFEGTPTAASTAVFDITIPASAVTGGAALALNTNADAKFNIVMPPPTGVAFRATQIGGIADTVDSTGIVLTFFDVTETLSQSVVGLTAGDITITDLNGSVTKGNLTGSGDTWTIALTNVAAQGDVEVYVNHFGSYTIVNPPRHVAVYRNMVPPFTITFNPSGGVVSPTKDVTGTNDTLSSLPTPTRSNSYRFDGWFTAASGGTQVTASYVFAADSTIYARWTYTGGTASIPTLNPAALVLLVLMLTGVVVRLRRRM